MKVCVVGLGKIGLPLAVQIASKGHSVVGCDTNANVVEMVNRGDCPIVGEEGLESGLREAVSAAHLEATINTADGVSRSEVVAVIVPAFLTDDQKADLTAVEAAAREVGRGLRAGTLVLFETTLPVGTTRDRLGLILCEESGLTMGNGFRLAFSPERVSSGQALRDLAAYPKVVGGIDKESGEEAAAFYHDALGADVVLVQNAETAELAKLMELTYRDVNIALANEFALCAERAGVDVMKAIDAANSQPYSNIHQPGVGVGGHCVPVNPWFLINGLGPAPLAELARQINDGMADEAVRLLDKNLEGLSGRTILILGLAYRANVKESYHSAALMLVKALSKAGASVLIHDPLFSPDEVRALGLQFASLKPPPTVDAIILQADHVEYKSLDLTAFPGCQLVLDGRNALSKEAVEESGLRYLGIGR